MDPQKAMILKELIYWVVIPVVVIGLFWLIALTYVYKTRKKNPERFKKWYGDIKILEDNNHG
jgi:hypothetical protein